MVILSVVVFISFDRIGLISEQYYFCYVLLSIVCNEKINNVILSL